MVAPWRLLEWQKQAIVDAIGAGEKRSAVAEEFGVSDHYPTMLARRRGLKPRPVGRPAKTSHFPRAVLNAD
jgi:hypothetical protein